MHHSQSVLLFYHILGDYYSLCTVSFVMFITRAQHAGGLCVCFCLCAYMCVVKKTRLLCILLLENQHQNTITCFFTEFIAL